MAESFVLDTSFWIALYRENDPRHNHAQELLKVIFEKKLIIYILWPIYYEVLRTKFVKKEDWVRRFKIHLEQLKVKEIDDSKYRTKALEDTILNASTGRRKISLVDMVIRHVLDDTSRKINYLITYNEKDFSDVC